MMTKIAINNEMVLLAREYRKMTQGELSGRVRATQSAVSKIESGLVNHVDQDLADDLTKALRFPLSFFTHNEHLCGIGSSAFFYRKKAKLTATDRKWIHSLINIKRIHVKQMLQGMDAESHRRLPRMEVEEYGSPNSVAMALRAFWNLPDGPIRNLTNLIESTGALVIPCHFGTDAMDATGFWMADAPPMIFINDSIPGDRWRFTLAHELGHLVMHEVPIETQEDEADKFASEFLMPKSDISPSFNGKLSIKKFASMKPYWKVSIAALIRRARTLGKISQHQYKYYFLNMGRQGMLNPEPNAIPREEPSLLYKLLNAYKMDLGYSDGDLMKLLKLDRTDDLKFLYGYGEDNKPKLRVIS